MTTAACRAVGSALVLLGALVSEAVRHGQRQQLKGILQRRTLQRKGNNNKITVMEVILSKKHLAFIFSSLPLQNRLFHLTSLN